VTNFAFQDRQMELQQLWNQYDALSDVVSGQEKQVIEANRLKAEQEMQEIEDTKALVLNAVTSGVATPQEMAQLNNPQLTNAQKQALAQEIMARGAGEDRGMAMQRAQLEQANIQSQIQARGEQLSLDRRRMAIAEGQFNLAERKFELEKELEIQQNKQSYQSY